MLTFSVLEYKERLSKVKEKMAERGIDVLLVTDPANMNYITGYDAWSFYVHQLLIVSLADEEPIWFGRGIDETAAKYTTWLKEENIISYHDGYVHSKTLHPMQIVADILISKGLDKKVIAAEYDVFYFTARSYQELTRLLPNATFVDAENLVNWIRIVKSDEEIALIKRAANIVTKAMYKGIESIAVGVRECDVVANIMQQQISGTETYSGDYPAIYPLLPSGEKTNTCHLTWTEQKSENNQPVIIEIAGCHKRYHSPLARTVYLGEPPDDIRRLADAIVKGIEAALDVIKPGITCEDCEDIELAWRKTISKHGFAKESRMGYSTGLNYPPDWGERTASIRPGDRTVLQPNMVFHMIPGIWLDHYGVEISETFRVTETGVEVLANVERKLFIK